MATKDRDLTQMKKTVAVDDPAVNEDVEVVCSNMPPTAIST